MAIDIGTESVALTVKERTWRVEIFCEVGNDPIIRAHREKVWLRPDGSIAQVDRNIHPVERSLAAIAKQDFGGGMTGLKLAQTIADVADAWRREDIEAAS